MIKIKPQLTEYRVSSKNCELTLVITQDKIALFNEDFKKGFIFQTANNTQTLDRWDEVIKLLQEAVKFARGRE